MLLNISENSSEFLAHLSRRLIGELIVYQWSGVHRSRPSSTMLKHLLLTNRLADQSQILCGASLGRGSKNFFAASGSHDQDGRHAHIWYKHFKNLLLQNRRADFHETWYVASGTPARSLLDLGPRSCDLGPRSCTYKNSNRIFSETTLPI